MFNGAVRPQFWDVSYGAGNGLYIRARESGRDILAPMLDLSQESHSAGGIRISMCHPYRRDYHKGVDRRRLIGKEDPRFIDQHSMSRAGTSWRSRDMEPQHIGYRGAVEETCVPEVGAQFQQAMLLMAMHCELCPIGE